MTGLKNDKDGVRVNVKNKEGAFELTAKKASLSCGRWIMKLVPETAQIMK